MRKLIIYALLTVLIINTAMITLATEDITDNFSTDSGLWIYYGVAHRDVADNNMILTDIGYPYQIVGIIWLDQDIKSPFVTEFKYKAGGGSGGGADGLVFMFYKDINYIPSKGGFLGFMNVTGTLETGLTFNPIPGYGIEFDNWYNGEQFISDPSENHISLIKDNVNNHLQYVNDLRTEDYQWHNVRVEVNDDSIQVFLDGESILYWEGNINRTYGGLGFGATSGGNPNNWHIIDDVKITTFSNNPPVTEAGGPYTVNEGNSIILDGFASSDPDGDPLTYAWDLNNDGIYETPGMATTITPQDGPADIIVGLQVSDGKGGIGTDTATITVNNVPPEVGPITINPPDPIVDTEIIATSPISDNGTLDTHTATWNWGDGATSPGTVSSGIASGNHIYATNGTFHIILTVTDNDGGSTTSEQDVEVKKPCKCEKLAIKPATQTHNVGKTIIVDVPTTIGTKNQSDPTSFDVTINTDWIVDITCTEGDGKCKGKYKPSVVSSSWDIDGKGGTVVSESHTGNGDITCEGDCGKTTSKTITTTYKATIQKGAGNNAGKFGNVLKTVTGKITLRMDPEDCPGNSWTMTLTYKGNVKADTDSIDYYTSDFDGDGKTNGDELKKGTDPLDPNSK